MWIYVAHHREHASNALPLPVLISIKLVPQTPAPARTAIPRIRASVSCDVSVYSPSLRWVLNSAYPRRDSLGLVDLGAWFCAKVVSLPVLRRSPIQALTEPDVE